MLLALTIAVEIGEISRFASPEKLVSYGRLAPRVYQSGQARPRSGPLSKPGSRLLGWAAVEAAQQAWRETNPVQTGWFESGYVTEYYANHSSPGTFEAPRARGLTYAAGRL